MIQPKIKGSVLQAAFAISYQAAVMNTMVASDWYFNIRGSSHK